MNLDTPNNYNRGLCKLLSFLDGKENGRQTIFIIIIIIIILRNESGNP